MELWKYKTFYFHEWYGLPINNLEDIEETIALIKTFSETVEELFKRLQELIENKP